jgi:hypothetical protein
MYFSSKYTGYIVNIWDPLNYQISLDLPENLSDKIYHEFYTYKDSLNGPEKIGKVYRCRLKNLRICRQTFRDSQNLIQSVINRVNGWVICKALYVDKYQRLIVELYDPVTFENFSDILSQCKSISHYT